MELKLERTQLRKGFSRTANSFEGKLNDPEASKNSIITNFKLLEDKAERLLRIDDSIKDEYLKVSSDLKEEDIIKDLDEMEVYRERWFTLKSSYEIYLAENEEKVANSNSSSVSETDKKSLKLPKLELKKFDGQLKNWIGFWAQFQRIHQDDTLPTEDKFQYLIQATVKGTRAREVVDSFPPSKENYEKVIECLKSRFGQEDLLIEVYIRELLTLVLKKANSPNNFTSLCSLYDNLESQIRALETLNVTTDKCASMLYPLVESCLSEDILRAWQRSSSFGQSRDAKSKLESLMLFLRSEVEAEERIRLASTSFGFNDDKNFNNKDKQTAPQSVLQPTAAGLLSTNSVTGKESCIFCGGQHVSSNCFKARKIKLEDKQDLVRQRGGCYRCLRKGHVVSKCSFFVKCMICEGGHEIVMCPQLRVQSTPSKSESKENKKAGEQSSVSMSNLSGEHKVVLQTLVVKLKGPNSTIQVRALIDTGSQKSYILKDTATRVGYSPIRQVVMSHSLFGGLKTEPKSHYCYKLELESLDDSFRCNFEVLEQESICDSISSVPRGLWLEELKMEKIFISDLEENPGPIEILLGADVAGRLFTSHHRTLSCGLVAIKTLLGWTLMGKAPVSMGEDNLAMMITSLFVKEATITDLWNLEALGITDPVLKKDKLEREAEMKIAFQDSITVNEEGRYEIALPWIENSAPLPSHRNLAVKRLESTTKKVDSENLYSQYEQVLQEWLKLGIIEEVPVDEQNSFGHYLPHRPVVKENSNTKVRPVFDASAKERDSPSLNQCLECGPNLIELIPSVLLRFRERKYAVSADIEKAFLQISIRPQDRDYLRFLWWNEDRETMKTYRHTRVVFGVRSSPFILGAVLDHHFTRNSEENPVLMCKLKKSFYVDNLVTSVDTKAEMNELIERTHAVLAIGKFNLRDWIYTGLAGSTEVPMLGLLWNPEEDTLKLNLNWLEKYQLERITKRNILSIIHKIFDPFGFLSPIFLIPKLLLQKAWKAGIPWDEEVEASVARDFSKWFKQLTILKEMIVPRWVKFSPDDQRKISIHTFCDASIHAYAAAVFVRLETSLGIEIFLLAAKSRVTPLKNITIPRLELMAATVGARLCSSVIEALGWKDLDLYFWTDSTTTLFWIQKEEEWTVFVSNRVKEIRELTNQATWRHVPGDLNPADLPSRGCSPKTFLELRWWEGPTWLRENEDRWPQSKESHDEDLIQQERKATVQSTKCLVSSDIHIKGIDGKCKFQVTRWYCEYFSNYDKMIKMVAWVQRFINNARNKDKDSRLKGSLTFDEIQSAERRIIRFVQEESFTGVSDEKLSSLVPYKDENNIIRLRTKIICCEAEEDFKRPAILPFRHPVVDKLILSEHIKNHHAKAHTLLNILRERFWILHARKYIRSITSKCVVCLRHDGKKVEAPEGVLPKDRIKDCAVFEVTGIDLAGPLFLKGGDKGWICLFTCAVYRAVHLEIVSALSTEAFLSALRRFVARRGRPRVIYSDNGTNFVGASRLLREVNWEMVSDYSNARRIEWKFIPPTAAWWGGWWERLIGVVKKMLKKVLGRACLSYEEMETILCDVEAVINSRPLTYVPEYSDELVPLSPSLFLKDIVEYSAPNIDETESQMLGRRLKYLQKLKLDLRKRFRSEYLGALIQKGGGESNWPQPKIGDVVIIESDNLKRIDWPLARIVDLVPGKDGILRLAKLRTSHNNELLRPVQRLHPLEVSSSETDCEVLKDYGRSMVPEITSQPTLDSDLAESPITVQRTTRGRLVRRPSKLDL